MFKEEKQHFALRKLTVGLASVLIGISFIGKGHVVKAETIEPQKQETTIEKKLADDSQPANAQVVKPVNASKSSQPISQSDDKPDVAIAHNNIKTDVQTSGKNSAVKNDAISNMAKAGADKVAQTPVKQDTIKADNATGADAQSQTTKDYATTIYTIKKTPISANALMENKIEVQSTNGLPILNTNDKFALDPKNGLHEHANVNDNGGYDEDFWGKIDVDVWDVTKQGDTLYVTFDREHPLKTQSFIVPNIADFRLARKDQGAKSVIFDLSSLLMRNTTDSTAPFQLAISKTNNQKVISTDTLKNIGSTQLASASIMDLHNLDTSKVTSMQGLFGSAGYFTNMHTVGDLSEWDTSNVTDMSYLFGNSSIYNFGNLSHWDVSKVTDMHNMFASFDKNTKLDFSHWDVSNVKNMNHMFDFLDNVLSINISNWDMSNTTDHYLTLFDSYNTNDHTIIANNVRFPTNYKPDWMGENSYAKNFNVIIVTNNPMLLKGFNYQSQYSIDGTNYTRSAFYQSNGSDDAVAVIKAINQKIINQYAQDHPGYDLVYDKSVDQTDPYQLANAKFISVKRTLPILNTNDKFALDPKNGLHEHANVNDNGGYNEDFWGKIDVSKFDTRLDGDMLEITGYTGDHGESTPVILPNISDFWVADKDQGAKGVEISKDVMEDLIYSDGKIAISKSNNNKLVAIGSDWSDLHSYFGNDILDIADLHNFDTHNITNMSNMFTHIQKAPVIGDISDWDTSHVTDMHSMFDEAYALTNLGDLGKWDVSHVVNASSLFNGATGITSLGDLSNWNTGNMVDMFQMFNAMTSLKSLGHLDKWNVAKVTDMSFLFSYDKLITDLGDLSGWDTSNVTNMYGTFQDMSNLKQLNISNWNLTKLTDSGKLSEFLAFDEYFDPTQTKSHLLVFANNIKLPDWYATGPASNQYFADHMVVLTNNPILLNQSGASDDLEVHRTDQNDLDFDSRSIFYDSKGTFDALGVISKYNDDFIKQYLQKHPGYAIVLAPTVDRTNPIALANASFNTVDSTITIKFVDDVDTDKTVPNTITASGQGSYSNLQNPPLNYEFDGDLPEMYYGNTYTVKVKHHMDITPQYDYASRQFNLHYPNGHTDIIIQRIGLQRNETTDAVTKKSTHTAWIVYDPDSSFTINGTKQSQLSYEVKDGKIKFAAISLPSVPGYKPVIRQGIKNGARTMMVNFIALPAPADKPQVPSTPAVINKPDNIVVNNNQKDWHIDQKADNEVSYTVTNNQVAIKLPKLPDQVLNLIKTSDYTLAFNYLKLNRPNSLIFNVKCNKHGYVLTILDNDGRTIKIINCKTYKELAKKIIEFNK